MRSTFADTTVELQLTAVLIIRALGYSDPDYLMQKSYAIPFLFQ